MASTESEVEKIQKHFQALVSIAPSLNTVSDELTQAVAILDEALKKLNIGLSAWVMFCSRGNDDYSEYYDVDQIGYCKVNGNWGIAIQHLWGDEVRDHHNSEGPWLFKDASREMRVQAVDKIPELIEELSKVAAKTQKKIQEKTKQVRDLAVAVRQDAGNKIVAKGLTLGQVNAITVAVSAQQKFVAEVVQQAHRWEWDGTTLRIYFSSQKGQFAALLESHESILKIRNAIQGVLGVDAKIGVHVEQQITVNGKVQK